MISGRVTEDLKAKINITINVGDGGWNSLNVVIDTGFNGQLALPEETVQSLGLVLDRFRRVTPAIGGTRVVASGYVQLQWEDVSIRARVIQAGTEPLVGMALFRNHRITIDAVADGAVSITPLIKDRMGG